MSQRAATITSVPMAFEVVKAMQAEGLGGLSSLGGQALQEIVEDQMAATDPPLQPDRGYSRLCAAHAGDRPGHPRRLRGPPVDARGGRDVAGLARTIGEPEYSEPGCQDARCRGGRLPSPAAAQSLPGADARRRRTFPQDRRRRPAQASSRRFGAAPRRQEGDHRLPLGGERKRRRMREVPRRWRDRSEQESLIALAVSGSGCLVETIAYL
jgi:hypothetical protein